MLFMVLCCSPHRSISFLLCSSWSAPLSLFRFISNYARFTFLFYTRNTFFSLSLVSLSHTHTYTRTLRQRFSLSSPLLPRRSRRTVPSLIVQSPPQLRARLSACATIIYYFRAVACVCPFFWRVCVLHTRRGPSFARTFISVATRRCRCPNSPPDDHIYHYIVFTANFVFPFFF